MIPAAFLVALGAVVNLAGTSVQTLHTLSGKNKPNRMSFLMWSVAPFIGAAASFVQGVTWAVVPVLVAGVCPLMVFAASYVNPNAYWKLGVFDYLCGGLSACALLLWWLTKDANIALIFAIASDAFAGWPTVVKAWRHPDTESAVGYVGANFSALMSFVVASSWSFASIAFPMYILCINSSIIAGVWRGKVKQRVI